MKTPEDVVHNLFTTYAHIERTSDEKITAESLYFLAARAIEVDRAQRPQNRVSFDALDAMLNAWEVTNPGNVPGFIQAWRDYLIGDDDLPEWARA